MTQANVSQTRPPPCVRSGWLIDARFPFRQFSFARGGGGAVMFVANPIIFPRTRDLPLPHQRRAPGTQPL
eukprot:COSAG01_NODE_455_length_16792_cov_112.440424_20_plen_70_part_00